MHSPVAILDHAPLAATPRVRRVSASATRDTDDLESATSPPLHGAASDTVSLISSSATDKQATNTSTSTTTTTTGTTKPATASSAPRVQVLFLDGMRGAAAMLVVCEHLGYLSGRYIGGVAVHVFFVLSAFLLTMLLDKKLALLDAQHASPTRWAYAMLDYAVRRVLRVYPLVMAIGLVLVFCSDETRVQWYDFKAKEFDYNFFKLLVFAEGHRFFVFWTLPQELTYYLLIPVFTVVTLRLRRWWLLPLLPLTGWIIYSGLYEFRTAGSSFGKHLPVFVSGSIGAVVYNKLSGYIHATGFTFQRWTQLVVRALELVVVVLLFSVVFDGLLFDWYGPYPFKIAKADHFICLYIVVLMVCEMLLPGPIASVFEWSLLRYAGKISFSMYLLHPPIIHSAFIRKQHNWYTKYFSVWAIAFAVSTVSYHAIEYPSQWLAAQAGKKIKAFDTKERELEKTKEYVALHDLQ